MKSLFMAAAGAAGLFAAPALAQEAAATVADDTRISQLIVYGADPCPESTAEEITVCARRRRP